MKPNIKAFNSKRKHEQQNQMATHRMGENICKQIDQQRINVQNIQIAQVAQYKKNNPIKKWEDLKKHFSKEDRQTDGQKAHEKRRSSTLLIIRELQSKLPYYYTLHLSE